MENRTENLLVEIAERGNLDDMRGDIQTRRRGADVKNAISRAPRVNPLQQPRLRLRVDDRPHVNRGIARVAHAQFARGAHEHVEHAIRDVLLQAQ